MHWRWVCLRLTDTSGGSSVHGMLLSTVKGRSSIQRGQVLTNTCSRLRRDVVMGTWWKAPSGKHYYVTAGSRRVIQIALDGKQTSGHYVVSRKVRGGHPRLSAVNVLGERVNVMQ